MVPNWPPCRTASALKFWPSRTNVSTNHKATKVFNRNAKSKVGSDLISDEFVGVDVSIKSCANEYHEKEECKDIDVAGVPINHCYCNTDLCNSATSMAANYGIFVILSVFYCLK